MIDSTQSRRGFLRSTLALGCSAAASPLVTPVTLAVTPGDNRLVVIILRGGLDGLDTVQPQGDRNLSGLRRTTAKGDEGGAWDLDGFFMAHPSLAPLQPLWRAGELSFAHGVSTPYRNKRSHFDGQDLLENGSSESDGELTPDRGGWLNRMLTLLPGATAETAFAVGRENMLLMRGSAPISAWSPDSGMDLSPQAQLLLSTIYQNDPLFAQASERAVALSLETEGGGMSAKQALRAEALASFAAEQLAGQARVAAFSINGWDTHRNQKYHLPKALDELSTAITTLKAGLGPAWERTAVLCMTEFGRTARENRSGGTDHGTGGVAVFAGGALKGGKVMGDWPGLGESDLFNNRDLMPMRDVRSYAAWALRDLLRLERSAIEGLIFPGLDMGGNPGLIA
ncbi:MAG: DUF1501 domain-containing protein [Pseudomonadota bacterium]